MCGAGTPVADGQPYGVFAWKPSEALVEAVSDLSAGGRRARERRRRERRVPPGHRAPRHRDAAGLQPRWAADGGRHPRRQQGRGGGRGERRERAARRRVRGARGPAGLGMRRPRLAPGRRRSRLARRRRLGRGRGRQPGGRIRGGPSRPGSAVPGPVLARGAPGGRRPRRAGHPAGRRRPGRAGGRARRGVPRRRIPGAARRRRGGLHAPDQHRHRRTGYREDDDHRAAHRDPRRHRGIGPAGGPRGTDREGGRAHLAGRAHGSGQARLPLRGKGSRGRAHGDNPAPAAGLATREPDPVPSRPPQPAALRRGRRRRDVDGVADPAGPPPRGDPVRTHASSWSATRTS